MGVPAPDPGHYPVYFRHAATQDHLPIWASTVSVPESRYPYLPDPFSDSSASMSPPPPPRLPDFQHRSLAAAKIYFNVEPRCFLMQYIIFQNYLNVGNKMLHIDPVTKSWIRRKNGPNMKKIDIEQFDRPLATGIYLTQ